MAEWLSLALRAMLHSLRFSRSRSNSGRTLGWLAGIDGRRQCTARCSRGHAPAAEPAVSTR